MKVVVFGVFDLFHRGHEYFLKQVSTHSSFECSEVHVVLATDNIVNLLKNKTPRHDYITRRQNIIDYFSSLNVKCTVHECDQEIGTYKVFREINPQVVCFGYDQTRLTEDLIKRLKDFIEQHKIQLLTIQSFHPEKYKTSVLTVSSKITNVNLK